MTQRESKEVNGSRLVCFVQKTNPKKKNYYYLYSLMTWALYEVSLTLGDYYH